MNIKKIQYWIYRLGFSPAKDSKFFSEAFRVLSGLRAATLEQMKDEYRER